MKHKKITKQLMGMGIQRNEAQVFARVYRKVLDAGMEGMFPEIVRPVMRRPIAINNLHPALLRAEMHIPGYIDILLPEEREGLMDRFKRDCACQIAMKMLDDGAIHFDLRYTNIGKALSAMVMVIAPGEFLGKGI